MAANDRLFHSGSVTFCCCAWPTQSFFWSEKKCVFCTAHHWYATLFHEDVWPSLGLLHVCRSNALIELIYFTSEFLWSDRLCKDHAKSRQAAGSGKTSQRTYFQQCAFGHARYIGTPRDPATSHDIPGGISRRPDVSRMPKGALLEIRSL